MLGGFSVGSAAHIQRRFLVTNLSKKKKDIHLYYLFFSPFLCCLFFVVSF